MKYYQLEGVKSDSRIVERFFESGKRYIKYVPFNPKILVALKQQFKDKPVEVTMNDKGWIVIIKTGTDETMEKAAKAMLKGEELTVERIAQEEMKMLKMAGYKVTYVVRDVDEA